MKKRVFIECAWCKKTIEVTPSQAKKRRHCNYKCKGDAMSYKTRFKGKIPKDYYHMEKREGVVCSYREFIDTYEDAKINHIKMYPEILNLRKQGIKIEEISKRTGIERHTVQSYITKKEQRFKNLVKTANNWRFTITPNAPKNTGSKVLSMMAKEGIKLWHDKYGDRLVLLETLVEKPRTGSVYLASGWTYVGETKGTEFRWMDKEIAIEFVKNNPNTMIKQRFMKFNDSINKNKYEVCITNNKSKKSIFVKPLHRYWRKELQRMD